jgi:aspartate racemase
VPGRRRGRAGRRPSGRRSLPRTKHIGIVACSAEGAALCYRTICREALEVVGKNDHPRITMDSIPLALWMPSFDQRDYRGVAQLMLESARVLATAGADFAICPDNSAHLAWKHVMAETPIPWLHIATVLGEEAQRLGYRRIGVLGTRFTMDGPVYRDTLTSMGIESVVPAREDRETVDRVIFNELVDGIVTDDSRREYNAVIARLAERGCDAVALACTEIPLLVDPGSSPLPTLDSTLLLARSALREGASG